MTEAQKAVQEAEGRVSRLQGAAGAAAEAAAASEALLGRYDVVLWKPHKKMTVRELEVCVGCCVDVWVGWKGFSFRLRVACLHSLETSGTDCIMMCWQALKPLQLLFTLSLVQHTL